LADNESALVAFLAWQIASRPEQSLVASRFKLFEFFYLEQGDNGNGM
jgi:hypothetical protein